MLLYLWWNNNGFLMKVAHSRSATTAYGLGTGPGPKVKIGESHQVIDRNSHTALCSTV